MTLLAAALDAASAGWAVFPCHATGPRAKAPHTEHGHLDASRDAEVIRHWWTTWPDAMVGAAVPDALVVLDVDPRNGGSVAALEALAGPVPPTLTAWSGRDDGGCHLYFHRPNGPLTSTRLPKGIDLKANGYVILPPSIHPASGKPYTWEIREVAPLSPGLCALLRQLPAPRHYEGSKRSGSTAPLIRLVAGLRDGERNRGLFWAACRAAEGGHLGEIETDLINASMSTGLSEREARITIASAARTAGSSR
jgi:hypothetical protein